MASAHLVPKLAHNLWDRYTSRIDGMGADEGRKRLPRSYEVGASCFTGAATMMLTNPLDCLKQRWQVAPMQSQRSLGAFTREILLSEGIFTGLWFPGLTTNVMACSISVGVRLGFYPMLRDALRPDQQRSGFSMFTSGLLGGALAYIISSPFFAASRVAQAEVGTPQQASGSIGTLARMARTTGVLGLWRGSEILVARGALLSATQLATYDLCKGGCARSGWRTARHCTACAPLPPLFPSPRPSALLTSRTPRTSPVSIRTQAHGRAHSPCCATMDRASSCAVGRPCGLASCPRDCSPFISTSNHDACSAGGTWNERDARLRCAFSSTRRRRWTTLQVPLPGAWSGAHVFFSFHKQGTHTLVHCTFYHNLTARHPGLPRPLCVDRCDAHAGHGWIPHRR